ncbi:MULTISPECIES: PASTA domain-containing protein [unclassified Nocardioides]|uniref:PASTA domain-containing protein n=1 Tax=unclassified Nocardioides TaxID=2615069 RepID=UPI0036143EB9
MDAGDYRDARWHSLLRDAEELGVPAEEAPAVVDALLARLERQVRRADDPDPLVRAELRDTVLGRERRSHGRRWPAVAVAVLAAAAVVGVAIALIRPDPPPDDHLQADQIPSLFAFDGATAERYLRERGLEVELQPFQSCEVRDRVVGTNPPPGTAYERGDRVTVFTAIPADVTCLTNYVDRELAWQWLDFALGRWPAPAYADRVFVYPGDNQRFVITATEATDRDSWDAAGVLAPVAQAAEDVSLVRVHPLSYAVPAIRVVDVTEGVGRCGVPAPAVASTSDAIAVLVWSADRSGCPLRVELYRDRAGRVEAVALYPAS